MARTKFSELREAVEARPGARERLAAWPGVHWRLWTRVSRPVSKW